MFIVAGGKPGLLLLMTALIKQPGVSFGSIFLLFSFEGRRGPHLLMTALIKLVL